MGVCVSVEVRQQVIVDRSINKQIAADRVANLTSVKLLLLGAGECGKSTILKQMQCVNGKFQYPKVAQPRASSCFPSSA